MKPGTRVRILIAEYEVKRFFSARGHLFVILFLLAAIPAALSTLLPGPFFAAGVISILMLHSIMDMIPVREREFMKLSVLPVRWEDVFAGKAAAMIILGVLIAAACSLPLCWMLPSPPGLREGAGALVEFLAVIIPLVHFGMSYSARALRYPAAGPLDLLARRIMMLVSAGLCLIPPLVLMAVSSSTVLLALYAAAAGITLRGIGVPHAAAALRSQFPDGEVSS